MRRNKKGISMETFIKILIFIIFLGLLIFGLKKMLEILFR